MLGDSTGGLNLHFQDASEAWSLRMPGHKRSALLVGFDAYMSGGWDGDDAAPITPLALACALEWLRALPFWVPNPEVAPGADGSIGFEWAYDFGSLYVDVQPDGSMHLFQDIDKLQPPELKSGPSISVFLDIVSSLLELFRPRVPLNRQQLNATLPSPGMRQLVA